MLEEGAYCPDIMIQVSAINCALNSFNKVLLAEHIRKTLAGMAEQLHRGSISAACEEDRIVFTVRLPLK